jgi:hypothetical protein
MKKDKIPVIMMTGRFAGSRSEKTKTNAKRRGK